jgi:hypothetical protein
MPSHIFFAMGMWDDAVRSNEDALKALDESLERLQSTPDGRPSVP